jgi:centrosomal protein CEP164
MKTPGLKATPGGTGGGDQSAQRQGPNSSHNQAGDSIILEEEIDPNYEPTEDEVIEYAKWLGMDLDADKELWWIAREGLKAPLPENWKPCKTTDTEEIYYFNFATGASTWDHPCDEYYRNLYEEEKKKLGNRHQTQEKKQKQQRERDDVKKLLGKDKKTTPQQKKERKISQSIERWSIERYQNGRWQTECVESETVGFDYKWWFSGE